MGFTINKVKSSVLQELTEILNPRELRDSEEGYPSFSGVIAGTNRTQAAIRFLEFNENGTSRFRQMKRSDLLGVIQRVANDNDKETFPPSGTTSPHPNMTIPRKKGNFPQGLRGIQMRDLRMLDEIFASSNEPTIVVRKQAIILIADPIRTVILRHSCYVFFPNGADNLIYSLIATFHEFLQGDKEFPFEFSAIDAILSSLCKNLISDLEKMTPLINESLAKLLRDEMTSGQLETLRNLKNTVNEFHVQIGGIRRVLVDILDNDEDLALLHLTKIHNTPEIIHELDDINREDIEIVLEAYLQDVHTTQTRVELMQHRIDNTQSLVTLKLDSTRNRLLTIEVLFELVSMCLCLGTLITGIFGMNLKSGYEESQTWFHGVIILTAAASILISITIVFYFRYRGLIMI